ncbi:exosortase [Elusimicrobiota bacterium]
MNKKSYIIVYTSLLAVIALLYRHTFIWLYQRYISADSYYSHGFIIPLISVYLIWLKRDEIKKMNSEYSFWGLILILCSLIIHFLGMVAGVFFVSGFSMFFLIIGLSFYMHGKKITLKILFPLVLLIFMFPLPLVAINGISFPMKMVATKIGVLILKGVFNLNLRNEGFHIFFPHASLIIGNPCSGLRSLITMMALGSVIAYLLKAPLHKRFLLFFLSVPVALVSNIIRIIMLSLAVYIYGGGMAKGIFHDLSGYFVFIIAFGAMLYLRKVLE